MELEFAGEIWYWRGPSPYHFVSMPEPEAAELHAIAPLVTYGWGVIPVEVRAGRTRWTTSLFPRDGGYEVPIKAVVRRAEGLEVGDRVELRLTIDGPR
jgi:hypothetical protein